MGKSSETRDDLLLSLHERLEAHFLTLHARRAPTGSPTFALEHGLSIAELALLKERVAWSVKRGRVPGEHWLPLIVYASEIGYAYSGDEFWQTFEAVTPGWAEHGDRQLLRARFRRFMQSFGGAEPSGVWAQHFSIICWPITHAVLPTDLQRQLARLLFESRGALTSELLSNPAELGQHLAARSWHSSSRFQSFAQNTRLLGRVAAALLAGEDERSVFLLDSTLERIVSDLSDEHQARSWLRSAKSAAAIVRTHGFQAQQRGAPSGAWSSQPLAPAGDPQLMLSDDSDGWCAYLELADLSALSERLTETREDLANCRALVAGAGRPLTRGRILYPGQQVRLSEWPSGDAPLLQLEGASKQTNRLLLDQCVLTPGPRWLFRLRDDEPASEVRGRTVRPAGQYVLVSEDQLSSPVPSWISPAVIQTGGVFAYSVDVPPSLDSQTLDALRRVGVRAIGDVAIAPAGLPAALWDGEGRAEWLAGESPVLVISSSRTVTKSVWALDSHTYPIEWPAGQSDVLVGFKDLEVGTHELHIALDAADEVGTVAQGAFEIRIRSSRARPLSGSLREALAILAAPVSPTLSELWNGDSAIEIVGPPGIEAELRIVLQDRLGVKLAQRSRALTLPVRPEEWPSLLHDLVLAHQPMRDAYGESEVCVLTVSHEQLGAVTLRCEREFTSLRWIASRDGAGPLVRLIDNTEEHNVNVRFFEFATPDRAQAADLEEGSPLRWRAGGLAVAWAGTVSSAAILPPTVHGLDDLKVEPHLQPVARSLHGVLSLIKLADLWGNASRPADPFADHARFKVLRELARHIAGLIGGHRWRWIEARAAREDLSLDSAALEKGVGEQPHQRALARDVTRWVEPLSSAAVPERVDALASALALHARNDRFRSEDPRFAEFLLRLASAPDSLAEVSEDELEADVQRVLDAPMLLRAARLLVLSIDARATSAAASTFAGWSWQ
jgi:hypothetical protein